MKVIETLWFTATDGCIGVVLGKDEVTGESKAYIGLGAGFDEAADTRHIVEWGAKITVENTEGIMKHLTKKED